MEPSLSPDEAALVEMFTALASDPAAPFRVRQAASLIADEIPWRQVRGGRVFGGKHSDKPDTYRVADSTLRFTVCPATADHGPMIRVHQATF